jgi:hypothetical protein
MGPGGDEPDARAFVTWVVGKPPVDTGGVSIWSDLQHSIAN